MTSLTVALAFLLSAGIVGSASAAPPPTVTEVDSACGDVIVGVRPDVTEERCWNAFGYWAHDISLFGGDQRDTGPAPLVKLESDASNSPQTANAEFGRVSYGPAMLFTSDDIDLVAVGRTGLSGFVRSHSTIDNINKATHPDVVNRTGSEILTADNITGQCLADESGATGKTTVTNGTVRTHAQGSDVGGHDPDNPEGVVTIPTDPPPNYAVAGHVHLGFATDHFVLVFNEQIVNADGTLTVNPVHEYYGYVLEEDGDIVETPPFSEGGSILHGHLYLGQVVCGVTLAE